MIHPHTSLVEIDPAVGVGVVASTLIPRGTLTWCLDALDQTLSAARARALPPVYGPTLERYTYDDGHGNRVLCWDGGRWMNHSCAPTCAGTGLGFEVALRDILPGEQLTNDYQTLALTEAEGFICRCGAPACRGPITAGDGQLIEAALLDAVREALLAAPEVAQPLASLLSDAARARLAALLQGAAHPLLGPSAG